MQAGLARLVDEECEHRLEGRRLGLDLMSGVSDDELAARAGHDVELDEIDAGLECGP